MWRADRKLKKKKVNIFIEDRMCVCACACLSIASRGGQAAGCYPGIYHYVLLSDQFIVDSQERM